MICPLDRQPCTMDHSRSCFNTCENQRREVVRRYSETKAAEVQK